MERLDNEDLYAIKVHNCWACSQMSYKEVWTSKFDEGFASGTQLALDLLEGWKGQLEEKK